MRAFRAFKDEESGFALITAVILLAVAGTASAFVLTEGSHDNAATGRGRSFVQALHVAESGVQQAIAKLQATSGSYSGTFTGSVAEGSYSVTVTKLARNNVRVDASSTVGTGAGLVAHRKLRVLLAPPSSFKYAMFSLTSVDTKNNDLITGDVWANQNVVVDMNDTVNGSITAATGYILTKGGSVVTGDLQSGGFNQSSHRAIEVGGTSGGSVTASVTAPTDPVTCGGENANNYEVRLDGNVTGSVKTWGVKTGSGTVGGTITNNTCSSAPGTQPIPGFTYAAANYDPATLHQFGTPTTASATAVSDFQAAVNAAGKNISGTWYVNQSGTVTQDSRLDLTGVTITGDTTIVTNTPIYANGVTDNTTDAIVVLASTYQPPTGTSCDENDKSDCSIHLKNNFQTSGKTAVLVYSPYGPVAVKNNQIQFGTVYAENILVKNNESMTYDPRVERVVGFGIDTLEVKSYLELNP